MGGIGKFNRCGLIKESCIQEWIWLFLLCIYDLGISVIGSEAGVKK